MIVYGVSVVCRSLSLDFGIWEITTPPLDHQPCRLVC